LDPFLVDYVKSGRAWLLIGSGPSIQRGYPSWGVLAASAVAAAKSEVPGRSTESLDAANREGNFPEVFEIARAVLGGPRLLQVLRSGFRPSSTGTDTVYKLLARWPIPVYLTTNYDDEIRFALDRLGESYLTYSNSPDHLAHLVPDLQGAIVKLHGDLTTEAGLVLTSSSYRAIEQGEDWRPWRTKMTSVFQMSRLIVVGHSLNDSNVKQVLEAAKQGAGVVQPVCWLAPNVRPEDVRLFLEKYRIRVVPYDDRDGTHRGLLRLLQSVDEFVPPRVAIGMNDSIREIAQSPRGESAGASGFFVFNKLSQLRDYDSRRVAVVLSAIEAELPSLSQREPFSLVEALHASGWPSNIPISPDFERQVISEAMRSQLFVGTGPRFRVNPSALVSASNGRMSFEHARRRFLGSLSLRIRRCFPAVVEQDANLIANDIEASMVGYFEAGGLSLVSTLFSDRAVSVSAPVPASILRFIVEASARYDDLLKRQAFVDASVGCFARPEAADKDYLGRISQGFVGFHMLGAFGAAAEARLAHAKESLWLVDSSPQIFALALGGPMNAAFSGALAALRNIGVRLFTTEAIFDETREHFWFANNLVRQWGGNSHEVMAAAQGVSPYRKSNSFLEGFIGWRAAGNPADWDRYVSTIFGSSAPTVEAQRTALADLGVETVSFQEWPGFQQLHFDERDQYAALICQQLDPDVRSGRIPASRSRVYKKAEPEGEALVVALHERNGSYNVSRTPPSPKDSWFVSATSTLNLLERDGEGIGRITWQPDSFVQFVSTLAPVADSHATERAFQVLLMNVARSGLTLLDERVVEHVFGGIIEQAKLSMAEQTQSYREIVSAKYGESPEAVMSRMHPSSRPLAALQLANEVSARSERALRVAEARLVEEQRRARNAERELESVETLRAKVKKGEADSRAKAQKNRNRARTGSRRKGKK
jgi:hypothetical protein